MTKISKNSLDKKLERIIYLIECLLALELNQTNLDRNKIRTRLGIGKAEVNKMLDGIKRSGIQNKNTKYGEKNNKTT